MSTLLRPIGPWTWLAELQALRLVNRPDPVELCRFGLYGPDGCSATVTDRLRLELVRVSLQGPVRSAFTLEIRSAAACAVDWRVVGGVVPALVERGTLAIVDFGPTTEWSIWGCAPGAPNPMSCDLRALLEHCCASPGVKLLALTIPA